MRNKLTITKVLDPREYNDKPVHEFLAKVDGKEAAIKIACWDTNLFQFIKPDAVIDADWAEKASDKKDSNGQPYMNRKILNIFNNGQPVIEKKMGRGAKSPEERASIEQQVKAKVIAELWIAGKFTPTDPEVNKLRAWLQS